MTIHHLLACLTFISPCLAFSQPVIQGNTFTGPGSNLQYELSSPAYILPFDLEEAGEAMTWDVSDLDVFTLNAESYLGIGGLNFFYQAIFNSPFNQQAQATHYREIDIPDFDFGDELPVQFSDIYDFYRRSSNGYFQVGNSFSISGLPIITAYSSSDRIYKFPLSYGQHDTSYVEFLSQIPFLGAYGQKGWRYNHADAWGTLITPHNSYDVVRVRAERILTDTINFAELGINQGIARPIQVDYSWLSPELDGEVMRISTILGQVVAVQVYAEPSLTNALSANKIELQIWPNPSAGMLHVQIPDAGYLAMYDLGGRRIQYLQVSAGRQYIDIAMLPEGLYLLEHISTSGLRSTAKVVKRE